MTDRLQTGDLAYVLILIGSLVEVEPLFGETAEANEPDYLGSLFR